MKVIRSVQAMRKWSQQRHAAGLRIGFVPTMGYLHEGHLDLVRLAKKKADVVVLSIYVNPTQFGPREDLNTYPRDEKGDLKKAQIVGVDAVFLPQTPDIYPQGYQTSVEVSSLAQGLCGARRPGHFKGVCTIVLKLFNIVSPQVAVFGKKDYQQYRVLEQMTADLLLPIKIIGAPITRAEDGLALSSRNAYLNKTDRLVASGLYQSLKAAKAMALSGEKDSRKIITMMTTKLKKIRQLKIDYIACCDATTLQPIKEIQLKNTLIAMAVYFGKTRLIDNITL